METYVSVDIETDGPIPGKYSMLSLGAVAFSFEGEELSSFSANLKALPEAKEDLNTMLFWIKNQKAWAQTRTNVHPPMDVMTNFDNWVRRFERPVFVAYPAGFDFTFVHWYFHYFLGEDPFGFQALDLKSYAMALMKSEFKRTTKSTMPKRWFKDIGERHSHIAVEDAREQGRLFMRMRLTNE